MTKGKLYQMLEGLTSTSTSEMKLYNALDEAKKDFPSDFDVKYKGLLFSARNIELSGDRARWFIEWFGDKVNHT